MQVSSVAIFRTKRAFNMKFKHFSSFLHAAQMLEIVSYLRVDL